MTQPEEERHKTEIVQLGQDFTLFNPDRIKIRKVLGDSGDWRQGTILDIKSEIFLSVSPLPNIPIEISADLGALYRYFGVTPFDPDIGVPITPEDFDVELRIKKWSELRRKRIEEIGKAVTNPLHEREEPRAPLSLSIEVDAHIFDDPRLSVLGHYNKREYVATEIKPEVQEVFRHLALTLIFPESSWSGVPDGMEANKSGRLYFVYFLPSGSPTLAVAPKRGWDEGGAMNKGVQLFVPDNLKELALIKGRFNKI
ncbi:MAG: hypothetical protein Q7R49_01565 [Candidatus Daviesbacteria bacterium]|nr:hypothetical protein [Candidatus Daviesbacteria bacterium]